MTVTPGNTTQAGMSAVTSVSWSHTVAAGTDRVLYVLLPRWAAGGNPAATAVTYGGAALTLVASSAESPGGDRAEAWRLLNPRAAAATVAVTFSQQASGTAGAVDVHDAHQATPEGAAAGATGTSAAPSVAVASMTDGLVLDALAADGTNVATVTVGAGQTALWNTETFSERGAASREAGAASVTMGWTLDASATWAQLAVPVRPSTAPELQQAPRLVAVGTAAFAASGPVTPTVPAGTQDGDVLLLWVHSGDNVAHDPGDEWTQLDQANNTTAQRTSAWWLRRGPATPANPTVAHAAGNVIGACVQAWRGVRLLGDPHRAFSRRNGTGDALMSTTALTGLAALDGLVFLGMYASAMSAMTESAGWVTPANAAQTTTLGNDAGLYTVWRTQPADGASDAPDVEVAAGTIAAHAGWLVALVPEPLAPATPPAAAAPPVTVSTSSLWPDQANARVGPYEAPDGSALYAFLVDRVYNKVRAFASTDAGRSWAQADSAHAPPCAAAAGYRVLDGDVSADGATVYLLNALSATALNVLRFSLSTGLWLDALDGPTVAFSATALGVGQTAVGPRAFLARGTAAGADYLCVLYNGVDETVSAAARLRAKLHQYAVGSGTWTGPYDVHGSANTPPANTLPGTTVAYAAAGCVRGAGARVHLLYQDGTALDLRHRTWTCAATGAFAASVVCAGADDVGVQGTGAPVAYAAAGGATGLAVPYTPWGGLVSRVARCGDSTTADTAGNWTQEDMTDLPAEGASAGALATPGALAAEPGGGPGLWWLFVSENQWLYAAAGATAGAWGAPILRTLGADTVCGGVAARALTGAVGVLALDQNGPAALAQAADDVQVPLGATAGSGHARAQSFVLDAAVTLRTVRVRLARVGAPTGNLTLSVRASSGGLPGATVRGTAVAVAVAGLLPTDLWVTFSGLNASLAAGATYWLVLQPPQTADAANYVLTRASAGSAYAGGQQADGTMATTPVWTAVPGQDLCFLLYTSEQPPRVLYDRVLAVLAPAAYPVGTTTGAAVDLGLDAPREVALLFDLGRGADVAGSVEAVVEHRATPDSPWGPVTGSATAASWTQDFVPVRGVARYVRATVTVAGGAAPCAVWVL